MKNIQLSGSNWSAFPNYIFLQIDKLTERGWIKVFYWTRKNFLKICFCTSLLYLFIFIYIHVFYYFHQELRFRRDSLNPGFNFAFKEEFEEFNIEAPDGAIINAVLFKTPFKPSKGVIHYFHGNAGNISIYNKLAREFFPFQMDVLVFDYRGYGKSVGTTSEKAFYEDAQMIYEELKKSYREEQIHLMGHSLGCAMAAQVASKNNPASLILVGPLFNFQDAQSHSPWFYPKVSEYKFRTDLYIQKANCPVYLFSGTKDIIHEASIRLSKMLKPKDEFVKIEEANHTDIFFDHKAFKTGLRKILEYRQGNRHKTKSPEKIQSFCDVY